MIIAIEGPMGAKMTRRFTEQNFGRASAWILTAGFIGIGLLSVALAVQCVVCSASINLSRTALFERPGFVNSQYRGVGIMSSGGHLFFAVDVVYGPANWQITPAGLALETGVLFDEARSFRFQFPTISTNPLRGCIPLWLVTLTCAVGLVLLRLLRRRAPRGQEMECIQCHYDLTGNTSGVCPECGSPVSPPAPRQ